MTIAPLATKAMTLVTALTLVTFFSASAAAQAPAINDSGLKQLAKLQTKVQKVIRNAAPAVVAIDDTGSGVVVSADGIVLTASHVTQKANRTVNVQFADGRTVQGITLGSNFATDTGAIRLLSPGPYPFLQVSESTSAITGTWCIAMGYPLSFPRGQAASGRLGRILERQSNHKIVADCTIMGGDSGGPLMNLSGKVIGINSSVKLGIEKNLYIPSERFVENWKPISLSIDQSSANTIAGDRDPGLIPMVPPQPETRSTSAPPPDNNPNHSDRLGRSYLGVSAETDSGLVRVRQVHPGSPAAQSGVASEDVIMAINSQKIASFQELVSALGKYRPATAVSVRINRFGQILEIPVTLGTTKRK